LQISFFASDFGATLHTSRWTSSLVAKREPASNCAEFSCVITERAPAMRRDDLALGEHLEHHGKLPAQARYPDAEVCLGVGHVQLRDAIVVHTCVRVPQIDATQFDFAQVAEHFRGQAAFTREHMFQSHDELVIVKVTNPANRLVVVCAHAAPPYLSAT
jgi:hypothetical protein